MRYLLMLIVAAWMGAACWAKPFVLSRRGDPSAREITLPQNATVAERHVAEEFTAYVKRITGAGLCAEVRLERGDATLEGDAFRICVKDGALFMSGGERGLHYAAYEVLERFGGCGWFSPDTEVVPAKDALSVPGDLDETHRPAFALRSMSWGVARFNPRHAAHLRLNGYVSPPLMPELGGAAYPFAKGTSHGHTLNTLLPSKTWFASHPEYFCERDGRRRSGTETQPCFTNPDVLRIVTSNVLECLALTPDARMVGVSQNDNHMFCECATCKAVYAEEESHTGALIRFLNAIAEEVEKVRPEVMVESLIYMETRKPPKLTKPRHNVSPCLCAFECDRRNPLGEPGNVRNEKFVSDLQAWGRLSDNLYIWDYTTNFRNYVYPFPVEHVFQSNLRLFRDNNAKFIFEEGGGPHADFAELKAWLLAKWMWNPNLDEKVLLDTFFAGYYGAAAPFVREYYDRSRALMQASPKSEPVRIFMEKPPKFWTPEFNDWALAKLAEATEAVKNDPVRLGNVRYTLLGPQTVALDRAAEKAKHFFVTRHPERFPSVDALRPIYTEVMKTVEMARTPVGPDPKSSRAAKVAFCAGPVWEPQKMATWKRLYEHSPDRTARDSLSIPAGDLITISGRHVKRVTRKNEGAILKLLPSSGAPMVRLLFANVAFEKDVPYIVRFRIRVDKGRMPGAAFRATLGPLGAQIITNIGEVSGVGKGGEAIELRTDEVKDGWQWYQFQPTFLNENFSFDLGSGPWVRGGGIGTTEAVVFDRVEIVRIEPKK